MGAHDTLRWVLLRVGSPGVLLLCTGLFGCGSPDEVAVPEEDAGTEAPVERVSDVVLGQDMLENAGIQTAEAGPDTLKILLRATATVVDNLDTQVHVTPRVGGTLQQIDAKLGDIVAKGDTLCVIDSVEFGNAVADYLKARSAARAAEDTLARSRQLFDHRQETLERVLDGAVEIAARILDREKDLKDRELTTLRPYLEADKAHKEAIFARDRDLTNLEAERNRRILELEVSLRAARVDLESDRNRLHILGMTEAKIDAIEEERGTLLGRYALHAPSAGIVTDRDATLSEFVDTGSVLFRIDNLERSWVVASVFEKDLTAVRTGQEATVHLNAFPGVAFEGKVAYVSYSIVPQTRAARVRIELDNDPIAEWDEPFPIRSAMFGIVDLVVATASVPLAIPPEALMRDGKEEFVFVREDELTFERRDVKVGRRTPRRVEILEGLEPGEQVVTAGTFELKSQLQKDKLGGDED